MLTDSTYREEFLDELTEEMRTTFREREEYLAARAAAPGDFLRLEAKAVGDGFDNRGDGGAG